MYEVTSKNHYWITNYQPAQAGYWKADCKVGPKLRGCGTYKSVSYEIQPTNNQEHAKNELKKYKKDQIKTTKYMI